MFLVCISSASALDDLLACYDHEESNGAGENADAVAGLYNGTIGAGSQGYAAGAVGNKIEGTKTLTTDGSVSNLPINNTQLGTEFTISMLVKTSNANRYLFGVLDADSDRLTLNSGDNWNDFLITLDNGSVDSLSSNPTNRPVNSWYLITITWEKGGDMIMYHNTTVVDSGTATNRDIAPLGMFDISGYYHISASTHGYTGIDGSFDTVAIFNRSLSSDEVALIYNNSDFTGCEGIKGMSTPPPANDTLSITASTPANNTQFNTATINFSVTFNSSIGGIGNETNCSLYINGTLATSKINSSTGINTIDFNDISVTDGTRYYNFTCDNTVNTDTFPAPPRLFYVDVTDPTIATDFVNNSIYALNNLTPQINLSDNLMLFSYNITIDGVVISNKTELDSTFHQYNMSYDPSSLSAGQHNLTIRVADGHTSNTIEDYRVTNGLWNDYLMFEKDNSYVKITNKDSSIFDSFSSSKEEDRYTWLFKPNTLSSEYIFIIEAKEKIYLIEKENTAYKKWLIAGDNWIDFMITNENPTIAFNRISDKQVEVTIGNIKSPSEIQFNSIGELNVVTTTYSFEKIAMAQTYTEPTFVGQTASYSLLVNLSNHTLYTTSAMLYWNGSNVDNGTQINISESQINFTGTYTIPLIAGLNKSVPVYWNFTIDTSLVQSNVTNQTIYHTGLDNCSAYSTIAVNFTLRLFPDQTLSNADLDIRADYTNPYGVTLNTTRSLTNVNTSQWCIYPNGMNFTVDFWAEYDSATYGQFSYYTDDTFLNNVSHDINLYMANGTSQIIYTVTDNNDDAVEDAYIAVLQYNPTTGNYEQVQVLRTDYLGVAVGRAVLNTVWYKFIITVDDVIRLETSGTKLTDTTKTFILPATFDFISRFDDMLGVQSSLTFNNETGNFLFTYTDPSSTISAGCLRVIRRNARGDTLINDSCVSATSGSITVNIGTNDGQNTYIGSGYVHFDDEFTLRTLSIQLGQLMKEFGFEGIFLGFFFVITLSFIAIWAPVPAVFLAMVAFIVTNVLGIFYLSWSWIVLVIIMTFIIISKLGNRNT